MNIYEALRMLELNGGYIYRDVPDEVGIEWDGVETWQNFEKDHVSLLIGDLTAIDWQHEYKEIENEQASRCKNSTKI